MIEVKNLTKKYGDHIAVNDLSFTVERGKIYGFLGPNGAGKSTTMNIITGCLAQTSGEVRVDGHDVFEEPVEVKKLIGYLPEIPPLYTDMTPLEYLRFVAEAKGIERSQIDFQVNYVMEKTGIENVSERLIANLSKGYRQRVGIAQAMLGDPDIIILDEPTVGLDPKQIIEIRDLIKSLGENHTVILSSHILSEIQAVCDYAIIIANGHVVASDTLENIARLGTEHPELHIIAKTDCESAASIIDEYEDITHYAITESEYGCDLALTLNSGTDLREQLFFDFAKRNIALIEMSYRTQSLEEIYLKLTEITSDSDDEVPESEFSETEKDADTCNSEEDSYTPLFADEPSDESDNSEKTGEDNA